MKIVCKLEQLEELKQKHTKEVIKRIEEIITIINENYGSDRDVGKDFGGYVALLESEEDVQTYYNYIFKDGIDKLKL